MPLGPLACILVLQIMSSLFRFFYKKNSGLNQLFSLQSGCHLGLALICHFFGFGPSSISCGFNLWLSSNRIALFYWMDHGPWTLIQKEETLYACLLLMNGR